MTRQRFERFVQEALETIPGRFRDHLKNVAILVEDEPSDELLREMEIEPPDTLFGLYHGTPLTSRTWDFGNALPDRISIFQFPIEDACETEDEVVATIGETLIHEVGHFFGMTEDELEAIEDGYWRRQLPDAGGDGRDR